MTPVQTIGEVYPICIGSLPREADCSRARYGILYGLQAAFPGHLANRDRELDVLSFGYPTGPARAVPVFTAAQVDGEIADLMAQWVRGFCFCFLNCRT